jgi:hypothetical protein
MGTVTLANAGPNGPSDIVAGSASRRRRWALWTLALVAGFAFRLIFGLTRDLFFEDETQIFLMGLRYYATGAWPYFGADVVWTKSEIPGALQALLVGIPLRIAPFPEAPYVLINVISMAALAAFAWYVTARLPLPKWLVWGWLMTLPWTLELSTHIINPSYLLAPAAVFFIGFFEAVPAFRLGRIPQPGAFALMGASIAWVLQIHMSWPLLLPYAALAFLSAWRAGGRALALNAVTFAAGALLTGSLLIPTFWVYGIHGGTGGTIRNLLPHPVSPWIAVTILARIFSFASLEIWRFLATDDAKRLTFLFRHRWIVPLAAVVWAAGIWQPIWMLRETFRTRSRFPEWRPLKWLLAATVLLVYASYWFVLEPSQAHAFYVVAPIGFMFAAYCWTFVDSPRWRRIAGGLLAVNVALHLGLAWLQAPERSLYQNRAVVAAAVRLKQPEMFANRRPFAIDGGPAYLQDPLRPYDDRHDVRFSGEQLTRGVGNVALWKLTLANTNAKVAYRDVLFRTTYRDDRGNVVEERADYVKDVFRPGAVVPTEVNDGFLPRGCASATIEVLRAEALLPIE